MFAELIPKFDHHVAVELFCPSLFFGDSGDSAGTGNRQDHLFGNQCDHRSGIVVREKCFMLNGADKRSGQRRKMRVQKSVAWQMIFLQQRQHQIGGCMKPVVPVSCCVIRERFVKLRKIRGVKNTIPGNSRFHAVDGQNPGPGTKVQEQNGFKPIIIDDLCVIHSTMHKDLPKLKYDITINPKMSFGSGSHETTRQLTRIILSRDFNGKNVLDMGCGTFILGIAASIKGASHITGIDIDEFSTQNAEENCNLNSIENYTIIHGDASSINTSQKYDYIFANIHKNIIINDLEKYVSALAENGHILLSGFYTEDADDISKYAETLGLTVVNSFSENNWTVLELVRR